MFIQLKKLHKLIHDNIEQMCVCVEVSAWGVSWIWGSGCCG